MTGFAYPEERKWHESRPSVKRSAGEDPVPAPSHSAKHVPGNYHDVPGWGADLDHANRPMFPMELPSTVMTARGDVQDWQEPKVKVHMSNEHPNLTPVFGTACPPKGLSGLLRDYAYQYGEATNRHWMTLILADRVDMVERLFGDAVRGHPDNYVKEKAWSALYKYADTRTRRKYLALGALALGAAALALAARNTLHED
jgi:hypothetical protein